MDVDVRVIVSPVAGVFHPLLDLPSVVCAGAPVGVVRTSGDEVVITSPFAGAVVAIDAVAGERLEPYQRVAWLRAA
jgi:hypothetical protein